MEDLELESLSWMAAGDWIVELSRALPRPRLDMTPEEEVFWPTYEWANNPWIVDKQGNMLAEAKFASIQNCTIEQLHIRRIGEMTYAVTIPARGEQMHQQAKLRRWGLAILLNAPQLETERALEVTRVIRMRHLTHLEGTYTWTAADSGKAVGTPTGAHNHRGGFLALEQQSDGIHWKMEEEKLPDEILEADRKKLMKYDNEGSIVFYAHPAIHSFPWHVAESVANKHVLRAIKKEPYQRYKGAGPALEQQIQRLEALAKTSAWQNAAMQQTPASLWAHRNELTEYQVWVSYRVALRQLNLYHEGRRRDDSCGKLPACQGRKETIEHIFWECPCARACWEQLIVHWTGEQRQQNQLDSFRQKCASRTAPALSATMKTKLWKMNPDELKEYTKKWQRLWRILSSICITTLWMQRNRVVFQQDSITEEGSKNEFWAMAGRQIRAIAKRKRQRPEKQVQGIRLLLCLQALEEQPREYPSTGMSPVQPPDQLAPALLTRLRTFQTSSRR
jgi:hypothetical protein